LPLKGTGMTRRAIAVLAGAILLATAPLAAQDRQVEQYACKDIMRDSGVQRDVALAFLHGYLLGKSGSTSFNLDAIRQQNEAFVERCLVNPAERAVDAMAAVKR
jgi:hypothetical protein